MKILFIHGNYPAQFHWLAAAMGQQSQHEVRYLTARADAASVPIAGVQLELYQDPGETTAGAGPLQAATTAAIERAAVIEARLLELAQQGFVPQLVVVHGGNGLGLLIKTLIPDCRLVGYYEWYFQPESAALLLGRTDRLTRSMVQLRNLAISQELLQCDAAVVPTAWQAQQFPQGLRPLLTQIFDGVDGHMFQPPADPARNWPLHLKGEAGAVSVAADQPLLTYATRGMEPLRGFPEFLRALPPVLAARPELQVLIAGRDRSAYGAPAPSHGGSWKEMVLAELGEFPGRERITFTGLLPRGAYRQMLQRCNLHCYFSQPYVTSWSLFEAVACGAPVLTNPGDATTGTLPGVLQHTVPLNAGPEAMAAAMLAMLAAPAPPGPLPDWMWRRQSEQGWQQLLNSCCQRNSDQA